MENIELNGWLNIDKPMGYSSAKVVAILKRLLKPKKIGHGGTLDPLATGVLPICINKATKTVFKTMDFDKEYLFNVTFGESRTTCDAEGEIEKKSDKIPNEDEIIKVLPKFIGNIKQVPPMFSAIKVDGKRAYDLARNGQNFTLKARDVQVFDLRFLGFNDKNIAKFYVKCGKGFYVRSIAVDIAKSLDTVGYVSYLRRISVGIFNKDNIISLDNVEEMIKNNEIYKSFINL